MRGSFWMISMLVVGGFAGAVGHYALADDPAEGGRGPRRAVDGDHGRPVDKIAEELGVTPEKFREVFRRVRPARRGETPTREQREENRKVLAEGLGVSPERLDEVMDKYRPEGPDGRPDDRGSEGRGPGRRGPEDRRPEGRGPENGGPEGRGPEDGSPDVRRPEGRPPARRNQLSSAREGRRPGPDGPGRPNGPPPHNSQRFVEHALEFDANGDGKLDRDELTKFADEMGRRRAEHEGRRPGPPDLGGPPNQED